MEGDLGRVVINEMPDPVMWDAPKLRPFPQGADGGLLARREYPARAEAEDIR